MTCKNCGGKYTSEKTCPDGVYHSGSQIQVGGCYGCGSCSNRGECAPRWTMSCCGSHTPCTPLYKHHEIDKPTSPFIALMGSIPKWYSHEASVSGRKLAQMSREIHQR